MTHTELEVKFHRAYQKILAARNILIITHFNPDGDGLSAVSTMIDLMEILDKEYLAFTANEPPVVFAFLPHLEKIRYLAEEPVLGGAEGPVPSSAEGPRLSDDQILNSDLFSRFDLILILDCGSMSRTTLDELIKQRRPEQYLIEIDHHPKVDDYTDLEIRDSAAAATVELVYRFFKANKIAISKNMANCILTGLITDTASFLYPATSDLTVQIASEMLSLGAHLPRIMENVLRNKSLEAMRLWGKVMANLVINKKYNIAVTALTNEDINGSAANKEEMDGISGFLSNLYGVNAILFMREERPGLLRGNLRTARSDVDVSAIATLFGGGGHAKASGFTIEGKLEKTEGGWRVV